MGPADYLQIVEKTLDSYQIGDRVCAITSYNIQSCINTRQLFASRNRGSFSVNEQSHVADLLIENVSELGWMATVIDKVGHIVTMVHSHKMLKARLTECIQDYNALMIMGLRRMETEMRGGFDSDQIPQFETHMRKVRALHRTAVMVEQMSATRFASAERVLNSFIRARPALVRVIGNTPEEKREFRDNPFYLLASRREKEKRNS